MNHIIAAHSSLSSEGALLPKLPVYEPDIRFRLRDAQLLLGFIVSSIVKTGPGKVAVCANTYLSDYFTVFVWFKAFVVFDIVMLLKMVLLWF